MYENFSLILSNLLENLNKIFPLFFIFIFPFIFRMVKRNLYDIYYGKSDLKNDSMKIDYEKKEGDEK